MDEIRGQNVKEDFIDYLTSHPSERFWQAVRNWSGQAYIWADEGGDSIPVDIFYWEYRNC